MLSESKPRTEECPGRSLKVNFLYADFTVTFNNSGYVSVRITGDEEMKKSVILRSEDGVVSLQGRLPGVYFDSGDISLGNSNGVYTVNGVRLDPKKKLKIELSLPANSELTFNKYAVGSIEYLDDTNAHALTLNGIMSGTAKSFNVLNVTLKSIGNLTVDSVRNALIVSCTSCGAFSAVKVQGDVNTIQSGTGNISIERIEGNLTAVLKSIGSLNIDYVQLGTADIKQSGTGKVTFDEGVIGLLTTNLSSIGSFQFNGHAWKGSFTSSSIGKTYVSKCTDILLRKSTSIGRIEIG